LETCWKTWLENHAGKLLQKQTQQPLQPLLQQLAVSLVGLRNVRLNEWQLRQLEASTIVGFFAGFVCSFGIRWFRQLVTSLVTSRTASTNGGFAGCSDNCLLRDLAVSLAAWTTGRFEYWLKTC
jgi:hypothetical protein